MLERFCKICMSVCVWCWTTRSLTASLRTVSGCVNYSIPTDRTYDRILSTRRDERVFVRTALRTRSVRNCCILHAAAAAATGQRLRGGSFSCPVPTRVPHSRPLQDCACRRPSPRPTTIAGRQQQCANSQRSIAGGMRDGR